MIRHALVLTLLVLATDAGANGITGNVLKTNGQPVWPCNIDIVDRTTNQPVIIPGDTTLASGHYNLVLPDGRYNLTFSPRLGTHTFMGTFQDARVQANTVTVNMSLPTGTYFKGKVVDVNNQPVAFNDIRFKDAAGNLATAQDNGTNADGTFNTLVVPGLYTAEIIPNLTTHKVPREFLNQNLTVADINMGNVVVDNGFILTCTVTDPSQFPFTGARITVRDVPGRQKFFTPTNNTSATGVAQVVLPAGGVFDVIALPPPGLEGTWATLTQYNWTVTADATLPNFALPNGKHLSAHVVGGTPSAPVANCDIDVDMQLPGFPRIETPFDITDALGNFTVTVASGTDRVTINPPVATKLLPLRVDNVVIGAGNVNMGTLTCLTGHWIDVTVLTQGTNVPVAGANIDLIHVENRERLITIDDVTGASGTTRIVSDDAAYTFKVSPPNASLDTAYVIGVFRSLSDTAVTVIMPRKGVLGVDPPHAAALRLATPWPNPARGGVHFAFAGAGEGELSIVDVTGRRVATPWQGAIAGEASAGWEARDGAGHVVPSGVYFAILRVGGDRSVRRIVIAN